MRAEAGLHEAGLHDEALCVLLTIFATSACINRWEVVIDKNGLARSFLNSGRTDAGRLYEPFLAAGRNDSHCDRFARA